MFKDTVMNYETIEGYCKEVDGSNNLFYAHDLHIAEAQAKITWEKAFKAGKREVVEFIGEKPFEHSIHGHCTGDCFACRWQAQLKIWFKDNPELLKEWGIG